LSANIRIGVDLGGTKIEAAALDRAGGIVARRRVPAPLGNYSDTVSAITNLVKSIEADAHGAGTIGIGIPGIISPATGLVKNANSVWLNGHPLDRDIAIALDREVRIANDANCFALSEAIDGAGEGKNVVFGVILGTGVGGGIVVGGKPQIGAHAIAGEWGHNPLPFLSSEELDAPQCWCGKPACIETFLSGNGLSRSYERISGKRLSPAEISQRALGKDPDAVRAMREYVDRAARALSLVINILDPDVVVLGGGLSNIAALYEDISPQLARYVFSDACTTPILKNRHGDSSGARGAAWLWD
jgi:fructokinase